MRVANILKGSPSSGERWLAETKQRKQGDDHEMACTEVY